MLGIKNYLKIRKYRNLLFLSTIFLIISLFLMSVTGKYADSVAGESLNDIILDYLPIINLSFMYVYVYLFVLVLIIAYPLLFAPEKLPFTVFAVALIATIRAIFNIMTHLGPPVEDIELILTGLPDILKGMYFKADLFFSGHVAIPTLGFFIFKERKIKWLWFSLIIVEILVNLFMHTHYSIDIFAAPFFSYAVFKFSQYIFKDNEEFKV